MTAPLRTDSSGSGSAEIHDFDATRRVQAKSQYYGGGSGGGGPTVDTHTKDYVDANMRAVKAENSANFARLEAKIDGITPGASWQQIAGIAAVTLGIVFSILAYASDRFDGGISANGLLDSYRQEQQQRDQSQDVRLDRILKALEAQSVQPQGRTQEGQD
ncbi:hypothetical protein [Oceanibium sediminis]|uniref:hypothetical protein n=1 Tax=Oceanibium sediminis TaxID=2026339 RepID=UPI0013002FAD|nr:hypothetical protein [Oceanibium sediminis]